ncbi:MAG TPA: hypothetical protein VJB56_00835 [Candidatus Paceibacterota bacterium]
MKRVSQKNYWKFLLPIIFLFVFGTQTAFAVVPVWDVGLSGSAPQMNMSTPSLTGSPGWFQSKEYFLTGLSLTDILTSLTNISWDGIADLAMRVAIQAVKNNALSWVSKGWSGGAPLFIEDPATFFGQFADIGAGQFLDDLKSQILNGNIFCGEFALDIYDIIPRIGISADVDITGIKGFARRGQCTVNNLAASYNDFSAGGWDNLQKARLAPNNPYGFMILALEQEEAKTQETTNNKILESLWGDGFLPVQGDANNGCVSSDGSSPGCDRYKTQTPAKTTADRTSRATNTDIDTIVQADELTEIITAIAEQFVQEAIQTGLSSFNTTSLW